MDASMQTGDFRLLGWASMAQRELNVYSLCGVLFEGVCPPYSATKAALHRPLETVLVGDGLAFVGWVRIHAMGTPCVGRRIVRCGLNKIQHGDASNVSLDFGVSDSARRPCHLERTSLSEA